MPARTALADWAATGSMWWLADSQGPGEEFHPRASIAGRGGVNHPAPHGAVRTDQGHDDPHQLSLSPPAAFRQADHDDGGLWARPAGHTPC